MYPRCKKSRDMKFEYYDACIVQYKVGPYQAFNLSDDQTTITLRF